MFGHVIILKGFFNFSLKKSQFQQRWNLASAYSFFRSVSFFCSFLTWLYCHCTDMQAGISGAMQRSGLCTLTTGNALECNTGWNSGSIVMKVKFSIWFQWGQEEDALEGKRDVPFKRLLLGLLENEVPQTLNNKGKCRSLLLTFLPPINYCANYVYLSLWCVKRMKGIMLSLKPLASL